VGTPAIPELLRVLELSGATVTIDTMGRQKNIAAQIDCGHGRVEARRCAVVTGLSLLDNTQNWAGLRSIIRIQATLHH
jgi:predicted transposase YbfD/YdcC